MEHVRRYGVREFDLEWKNPEQQCGQIMVQLHTMTWFEAPLKVIGTAPSDIMLHYSLNAVVAIDYFEPGHSHAGADALRRAARLQTVREDVYIL